MEENIMNKINVEFNGGESRQNPGVACDYMIAKTEIDGEEIELYAEILIDDFCKEHGLDYDTDDLEAEDMIYQQLRDDIVELAREHGILENAMHFSWD